MSAEDQIASARSSESPIEMQQSSIPHAGKSTFLTLDRVMEILGSTIFSTVFCIFVQLSLQKYAARSSHPILWAVNIWATVVAVIRIIMEIDRIYTNQHSILTLFSLPTKLKWSDQIVLITGGASGLGHALARALSDRNATVVVLDKMLSHNEQSRTNIHSYICDVTKLSKVEHVAAQIIQQIGSPTIIVNNAGVVKGKLILDLTEDDVTDTLGVNTTAHFWILKTFLPDMIKRGTGHIVSISSVLGILGAAQCSDYCASKAAVINLHQSLRFELDNRYRTPNIRTTLVLPAFIQTRLFAKIDLPNALWFHFLAPPLHPDTVVKTIIDALDSQESRVIRLPFYTQAARIITLFFGLLPQGIVNLVQWITNADHAMKAYGPHPDAAEKFEAEAVN